MKRYVKCALYGLAILAALIIVVLMSHGIFAKKTDEHLIQLAYAKNLEMDNGTRPELKLAMQMVSSPLVKEYMERPDDPELQRLAFREFKVFQDSFQSHRTFWISDKDLRYYSNMEFIYTLDKSDPGNAWYEATLRSGVEYQFYVDYDIGLKKTYMWINALVYNNARQPIGIAGTGIELTDFVDSMYANLEKGVEMYMYNSAAEISGSLDLRHLENKTRITAVFPELTRVKTLFPTQNTVLSTWKGEYVIVPLERVGWTLVMFMPYTFKAFLTNAGFPFAAILVVLVAYLIITALINILTPLTAINAAVQTISSGDADLTKQLDTNLRTSFKVIPAIVAGFNTFVQNLARIIAVMKQSKTSLITAGKTLSTGTNETMGAISQIIDNIEGMNGNLARQNNSVEQTAGTVNEILTSIDSLEKMVSTQAGVVKNASGAVEEMIGNIRTVNVSVDKMAFSFGTLAKVAESGAKTQTALQEHIANIEKQSKLLNEANSVIANIAEQTNLLAMNAAIEAAHAGEAGKGFAVVADEIRKLSETSTAQSKTIGEQLNGIQETIGTVVKATQEGVLGYTNLAAEIRETDNLVKEIKASMQEQQEGSARITESLGRMNESAKQVKGASDEMTSGSRAIMSEVRTLQEETQNIKDGMQEMSLSAKKIKESGSALKDIASLMEDSISEIGAQVDQFKV